MELLLLVTGDSVVFNSADFNICQALPGLVLASLEIYSPPPAYSAVTAIL